MLYDSTDPDYQAYFADAANAVQTVLAGARQQVVCALAQTCSRHCFDLLLQVSRRGVALRLLVPDTAANRQAAIDYCLHDVKLTQAVADILMPAY